MWNIYLKVAIEKNWLSQNFDFLSLKSRLKVGFFGAPTHADIIEVQNFLLKLKNQRSGSKGVRGFSIILILKGIVTFKVKESMLFVDQKYKL